MLDGVRFLKGHGTGNDFVILPDPDGRLDLTPRLVAALCDRRRGIGADGVLRVVRTTAHPRLAGPSVGANRSGEEAEWFMDYWNSDGSIGDTCGNGLRVFTHYLMTSGLAAPGAAGLPIMTRAGVVRAIVGERGVAVDMNLPRVYGESSATVNDLVLPGTVVTCGNPNLVCVLPAGVELPALDLSRAPGHDPEVFPHGVNVEFVTRAESAAGIDGGVKRGADREGDGDVGAPLGPDVDVHVRMRVYERGSAETLSCGSGACAVAAVALRDAGRDAGLVAIDVPGGRLTVTLDADSCWLAGPAVLVAEGEVNLAVI